MLATAPLLSYWQGDRCAVFAPCYQNARQPGCAASVMVLQGPAKLHSAASSAGGSRQRSSSLKSATCRWPAALANHKPPLRCGRTTKVEPRVVARRPTGLPPCHTAGHMAVVAGATHSSAALPSAPLPQIQKDIFNHQTIQLCTT
jgi:hypothetical protein